MPWGRGDSAGVEVICIRWAGGPAVPAGLWLRTAFAIGKFAAHTHFARNVASLQPGIEFRLQSIDAMGTDIKFDIAHTAVLAMDCQAGIVSIYVQPPDEFLGRAQSVLAAARKAGMAVIHVQVGFRPGLPEVSSRNKLFAALKANPQHQQLFLGPAGAVHPALGPEPDDIVVTKHRVSAFSGSDLEMLLRAGEIDTLIMFGIATSGVVLSTLTEAFDLDYKLVVISDCCADRDAELHAALLKLFASRGDVLTAAEFVNMVENAQATV
jgi:nicotinamidase-related amidase